MSFSQAMQMASPFLLGMASDMEGRTSNGAQVGLAQMTETAERDERKAAVANLLGEMGLGPQQRGLLDTLPVEMQQQYLLDRMQQKETLKRQQAAAGASAARKAQEQQALAQQWQALTAPQGGAPEPSNGMDGQVGPTVAAAAPDPYTMYKTALARAYSAPPGTVDQSVIKGLEDRMEFFAPEEPKERQILKGADGFNYFTDTGERVLPGIETNEFDADRFRVVGNTLYDLASEGGPQPVGTGQGMEEVVYAADGTPILTRGPAGTSAKFTETQAKDNVFVTRAEGALNLLDSVDGDALTSRTDRLLDGVPLGIGRELQNEDYQVAKQSGDEFLQAILRKDTGAAITEQEQDLYGKTYLPQPGDGQRVLEAKRQSRIRAIEAIRAGMNIQQVTVTERALIQSAQRAENSRPADAVDPAGGSGSVPKGVPDDVWAVMTPEEKALWDE